jgi:hypothetical protein
MWEQTAIISVYSTDWLVLITAIRADRTNNFRVNFSPHIIIIVIIIIIIIIII